LFVLEGVQLETLESVLAGGFLLSDLDVFQEV